MTADTLIGATVSTLIPKLTRMETVDGLQNWGVRDTSNSRAREFLMVLSISRYSCCRLDIF